MSFLKICFWNANGINQRKNEVSHFLQEQDIDVLLVSETHLTNKYNFNIPGFVIHKTNHPDGKAHGGTAILIRNKIRHYCLEDFSKDYLQATTIHIDCIIGSLTLSSVYCPPRFKILKDQFEEYFEKLGNKFLACGDYNAKHTYWGSRLQNPKGKQLYLTLVDQKNGLDFLSPRQPTYWPTDPKKIPDLIDLAITKNINRNSVSIQVSNDLSSDHSPIIVLYSGHVPIVKQNVKYKTNWLKYKKYISSHIVLNPIMHQKDQIENAVKELSDVIVSALDLSKTIVTTPAKPLVTNSYIESLVLAKRRARRNWQNNRSPSSKQILNQTSNKLKRALQDEEDRKNSIFVENLTNTKYSNYSLWKATKRIKPPAACDPPLRKPDGTWARNSEEKAILLANHLSTVFQPNHPISGSNTLELPTEGDEMSETLQVTTSELKTIIKDIKPKKSSGHDKITPVMIKNLPDIALTLLATLFNAMLLLGFFPEFWKISEIILIPKPGKDLTLPSSYRPISLLPCLSKLFEKVLLLKIKPYLISRKIIPDHQFGFRENHGTIEQVNRITLEIRKCFEQKKYCSAIFLDVAQAFDKVWHEGLIYKIKCLLPKDTHKILESYLSNRKFRVKYVDHTTNDFEILAGVPQGSVLGPTLYLIYTADIPQSDLIITSTFADDTALLSTHSNPVIASQVLNNHLRVVESWLNKWRIKVNELKSKHVTFSLRVGDCPNVVLNNVIVPQANSVKYLGIHIDRRLTWRSHIDAKKAQIKLKSIELNWLIGAHSKLSLDNKVIIYNSVIKPIWMYGLELYGNTSNSNIELIQRTQSKILRAMTGAPRYLSNDNIQKDLEIPPVKLEFQSRKQKYMQKLTEHPNSLARSLANISSYSRLRRADMPPVN